MPTNPTKQKDPVVEARELLPEQAECESCRMFDHNACEYAGIDGFCCCEDED